MKSVFCILSCFAFSVCSAQDLQNSSIDFTRLNAREIPFEKSIQKSHSHKDITINMTLTIPQLVGPIPVGGNLDVTPFAISPRGKIFLGKSTNIVPASGLIQDLKTVKIRHCILGNYTIGYFITLGSDSPPFSSSTIANFSGVVLNNPVRTYKQTITFPVQTLFLASLMGAQDRLTITANFPIFKK